MTDWNNERVRALVAAAENAVQRTRWVFLVLNLGCAIMITAQLNLYGTWVRNVKVRGVERIKQDEEKALKAEAVKDELLKKEAEREKETDEQILRSTNKILWDDLYTVSMPLLGIKYSADDLIILGTASMSVLALWFVYAHRRENHCIGDLKDIAMKTTEPGLASYIYFAVAHHFVFTTTTLNDATHGNEGTKTVPRGHVTFLIHLPWIASLMVVLVMAMSLFVPGIELVHVVNKKAAAFPQLKSFEQVEAIGRMVSGLALALLTMYYCFQAQHYDRKTHKMLVEMRDVAINEQKSNKEGTEKQDNATR